VELVPILALIAFGAGAVLAFVSRAFALALVATGLFLLTLPRVV
jgi:hypothetical protein